MAIRGSTAAWALGVLLLAGCATAPISPALQAQAVPVDFAELAANPDQFKGETVILGGQIIDTVPFSGGTRLVVLETRTEDGERPQGVETSQGRFMALAKDFLDPQVYAQGRQVTVVGTVAGRQTERLGDMDYAYPAVQAEQVYLWPPPTPRYYYPYNYPYSYYYPYYGPWGPFYPGPVFVVPRGHRGKEQVHPEEGGEKFREGRGPRGGGRHK